MASSLDGGGRPGWLLRILTYAGAHRRLAVTAVAASSAVALLDVAAPLAVRHVVDTLLAEPGRSVWPWVGVLVSLAVLQYGASFGRRLYSARLAFSIQHDMRRDLFATLTRLDGASQDALDTGQVVSRSITDLAVMGGVLVIVPSVATAALLVVLSVIAMAFLSPVLTLVTLAVLPTLWWRSRRAQRDLFPANWDAQQQAGSLVGRVEAAVTGVRVVKGFGQEDRELAALEESARRLFASRLRAVRMQARFGPALKAIPALGQVGVLVLGGWLALHGEITLGTFLAFTAYLAALVGTTEFVAELLLVGPVARAGVERIDDLLRLPAGAQPGPDAVDLPDGPLGVEFDRVTFGRHGAAVLDEVRLSIDPGETVAVVGSSGTGKSTVSLLLPALLRRDARRRPGRRPRRARADHRIAARRHRPGPRTASSSPTRSRTNIAYGRPDATGEEIEAAARAAQADRFIAEPCPRATTPRSASSGLTLSGGQRQRVALARAILTDPGCWSSTTPPPPWTPASSTRSTSGYASVSGPDHPADRPPPLHPRPRRPDRRPRRRTRRRHRYPRGARTGRSALSGGSSRPDRVRRRSPSAPPRRGAVTTPPLPDGRSRSPRAPFRRRPVDRDGGSPAPRPDPRAARPGRGAAPGDRRPRHRRTSAPGRPTPRTASGSCIRPVRAALLLGLLLVAIEAGHGLLLPAVIRHGIDDGVRSRLAATCSASRLALAVVLVAWGIGRAGLVDRPHRRARAVLAAAEDLRPAPAPRTRLLRARADRPDHDPDDDGRRCPVDVPADGPVTGLFVSVVTFFGILVALLLLDAELALVVFATLPLLVVATYSSVGRASRPTLRPRAHRRRQRRPPGSRLRAADRAGLPPGGARPRGGSPAQRRYRDRASVRTC